VRSERAIVVVGAGAAGLCAATTLAAAGWPVIVLEARRRVGGRIFTRRARGLPLPIELGAEFVHGAAPLTRRILRSARIGEHEITGGHVELRDGTARRRAYWPALDRLLRRVDRSAPDRSFADFLSSPEASGLTADERAMASSFVQGFHAADPARLSLHSIAPREGEGPSADIARAARLLDGYDALPRSLAARLGDAVRLGHVVRRIVWRPGRVEVTVTHADGEETLRARAAVVTVPLGVLQAGSLELEPRPPRWERAWGRLAMGSAMGVNVALRESPWRGGADLESAVRRAAYLHTPGGRFNVWFTAEPFDAAQLVAWSGGPPAASLLREGKAAVLRRAVDELARACGAGESALRRGLAGAWVHDWDRDRFSRGAYSYALVGGAEAGRDLARPVEGTLFLAGEATVSDGSNGTVEGALASGRRAARQVMRAMRHSAR
jgi:monoamine oxidase